MSSRRTFFKQVGVATGAVLLASKQNACAERRQVSTDQSGVLVDTTRCIGCRRCEKACNDINTDLPRKDAATFKDESVFDDRRRMDAGAYTVVNKFQNDAEPSKPVFAKFQCMHCLHPACASACIVGALTKDESGAVVYDAAKCIGCRYCMAACPFQVPAYEYDNALTPQVRKCTFCFEQRLSQGGTPACVQSCPMEVMTFGNRSDLLKIADDRIKDHPDRYVQHIYGENEAGGTAWLYLSKVPFQDIDLPSLGYHPLPDYTEAIQHAIFKWFLPPIGLYAALGGIWWYKEQKKKKQVQAPAEGLL